MTGLHADLAASLAHHQVFIPQQGVVRLPTLTRGRLNFPRQLPVETVRTLIEDKDYLEIEDLVLVREPTADAEGATLRRIFVLPSHENLAELIAISPNTIIEQHANLHFERALELIEAIGRFLSPDGPFQEVIRAINAEFGQALPSGCFFPWLGAVCNSENIRRTVDRDLAWGQIEGSQLLSDWHSVGTVQQLANVLIDHALNEEGTAERAIEKAAIRALPTRQLHITSGNTSTGPLFSLIRGLSVKGAITLKMSADSLISGGALAVALAHSLDSHPLVDSASVVYWKGGDTGVEESLFHSELFDRIVVSAGHHIQASIRAKCREAKVVSFGPRIGVSLLCLDDTSELTKIASRAVADSLIADQASCDASIIHFVEADRARVLAYAEAALHCLARWDIINPRESTWEEWASIRRERRGRLASGAWLFNGGAAKPTSAVVVADASVSEWIPPMRRVILIQPVMNIKEAVQRIGRSVSTAGIYPERARIKHRNEILARGASAVIPLGSAGNSYPGMPREGIRPLSELVSWVTG
jgi:hypothetical protein